MPFYATTAQTNRPRPLEHIESRPISGALGAEVCRPGGAPLDVRDLDEPTMAEIRQASADHLVVVFRGQSLGLDDLEEFSRRWGPFGEDPFVAPIEGHPHVVRVLKEATEAHPFVFGGAWHSDWSFQPAPPAFTILYGHDIPPYGGDTMWANMELAYDHVSPGLRRVLHTLTGLHSPKNAYGAHATHNDLLENMSILYGERAHLVATHPLVRRHPVSGRAAIFANPGYTVGIDGWRPEEAQLLLDHLYDVATNPAFTCRLHWQPGTLAVWDNRSTLHNPISDYHGMRRELWRVTIRGEVPIPVAD